MDNAMGLSSTTMIVIALTIALAFISAISGAIGLRQARQEKRRLESERETQPQVRAAAQGQETDDQPGDLSRTEVQAIREELRKSLREVQEIAERLSKHSAPIEEYPHDIYRSEIVQSQNITERDIVSEADNIVRTAWLNDAEVIIALLYKYYDTFQIAEILAFSQDDVKAALEKILVTLNVGEISSAISLIERSDATTPQIEAEVDRLVYEWWIRREDS
jgi:DNA-binding CsgD family transcriptional regulator